MSDLIFGFDWASTSLGPLTAWPDRLRAAVDTCLASVSPGVISWGPEHVVIYNDAAAPLFGSDHPSALGRPIEEIESELWRNVSVQIRKIEAAGGGTTWIEGASSSSESMDGPLAFACTALRGADDRIAGASTVAFSSTEPMRQQRALVESEQRLRLALQIGRLAIFDMDVPTGQFIWTEEVFRMLGYEPGEVKPSFEAFTARIHPDDIEVIREANAIAEAEGRLYSHSYRIVLPSGELRWCSIDGRYFHDQNGAVVRLVGVMQDTTERHQYEETQRLLIAELQHRTRNLLTVVQAIAAKTLGTSQSLEDFKRDFNRRLAALGRVQTLISGAEGGCPTLSELVLSELSAHGASPGTEQVVVRGEDAPLSAPAVQLLALAIHELATNALKYGALAQPQARLLVTWTTFQTGARRSLDIRWVEENVRVAPGAMGLGGFGRELIERALPRGLGAQTRFEFAADGVHCEIVLPL